MVAWVNKVFLSHSDSTIQNLVPPIFCDDLECASCSCDRLVACQTHFVWLYKPIGLLSHSFFNQKFVCGMRIIWVFPVHPLAHAAPVNPRDAPCYIEVWAVSLRCRERLGAQNWFAVCPKSFRRHCPLKSLHRTLCAPYGLTSSLRSVRLS